MAGPFVLILIVAGACLAAARPEGHGHEAIQAQ